MITIALRDKTFASSVIELENYGYMIIRPDQIRSNLDAESLHRQAIYKDASKLYHSWAVQHQASMLNIEEDTVRLLQRIHHQNMYLSIMAIKDNATDVVDVCLMMLLLWCTLSPSIKIRKFVCPYLQRIIDVPYPKKKT